MVAAGGSSNDVKRRSGNLRKKKECSNGGGESLRKISGNGEGRVLVPYFVPEDCGSSGVEGGEGLRVNESLVAFDDNMKSVESYEGIEEVVRVRTWDKSEGYFVDGGDEGGEPGERRRGKRAARGRGRRGSAKMQGRKSNSSVGSGGRREKVIPASSSPVGVMPTSPYVPSRKSSPASMVMETPTPKTCRFAGSSFESASPSPLALPLPNFAKRVAEAVEEGREGEVRLPAPGEQLKLMSVDLMRLLKI